MVSARCITLVKGELTKLGFQAFTVDLGHAEVKENVSDILYNQIRSALLESGFELVDGKRNILVNQIKTHIIQLVHYTGDTRKQNLSVFLTAELHHDYTYMSNLFSAQLGITIEKFYICHKIERVKELLLYDELTLTEIAYKLDYSSVAHLSAQFKKVTGLTPSGFKQGKGGARSPLEDI